VYADASEEAARLAVFEASWALVQAHNAAADGGTDAASALWRAGINALSDRNSTEMAELLSAQVSSATAAPGGSLLNGIALNMSLPAAWAAFLSSSSLPAALASALGGLAAGAWPPPSFDWRLLSKVTGVKNQGSCGSCYSFSSAAVLEGARAIATGVLEDLSPQQVLDCSYGYVNDGCKGGYVPDTLRWIKDHGGVCRLADYPAYVAMPAGCRESLGVAVGTCPKAATAGAVYALDANMNAPNSQTADNIKKLLVLYGPMEIVVHVNGYFQSYAGGILTDPCPCELVQCKCKNPHSTNHVMTLVGYGSENGTDFWSVSRAAMWRRSTQAARTPPRQPLPARRRARPQPHACGEKDRQEFVGDVVGRGRLRTPAPRTGL